MTTSRTAAFLHGPEAFYPTRRLSAVCPHTAFGVRCSTFDVQRSMFNVRCSTFDVGLWALGVRLFPNFSFSAFQPFLGCWLLNVRLFPNFSFSAFQCFSFLAGPVPNRPIQS
jgi:hypothetical protein